MSDNDSTTAAQFESKDAFFEAVRDGGAILGGTEYYTEGNGAATSYKARTEDSDVEDVKKSDVEAAWEERYGSDSDDGLDDEEDDGPEEVHLGTFYYSKANWTEEDRKELERLLEDAGWFFDSEVDSGGYRIKTER